MNSKVWIRESPWPRNPCSFFLIEKSINSRSDGFLDLEKPVMEPTFTWDPHHLRSFRLCCLCLCSDLIMYIHRKPKAGALQTLEVKKCEKYKDSGPPAYTSPKRNMAWKLEGDCYLKGWGAGQQQCLMQVDLTVYITASLLSHLASGLERFSHFSELLSKSSKISKRHVARRLQGFNHRCLDLRLWCVLSIGRWDEGLKW